MLKERMEWLSKNINAINSTFGIETNYIDESEQTARVYEEFIDVYDTRQEFNEAFCNEHYPEFKDAFEQFASENLAAEINGKFVFFTQINYDFFISPRKEDSIIEDNLVCKICGYKQTEQETIKEFMKKHVGMCAHDIPYYCGACLDNMTDEEYEVACKEMDNTPTKPKKIIIQTYRGLVDSVFTDIPDDIEICIQDVEEDADNLTPTDDLKRLC